jgi:peptide deformylase
VAGVRDIPVQPVLADDEDMPFITLINPEVTLMGPATEPGWEGCLSIPDIRGRVPRAPQIQVRAYDRSGRKVELVAGGLPARVIQHETDHLDGILFFDRMTTYESLTFMDEYRRYWVKDDEDEKDKDKDED